MRARDIMTRDPEALTAADSLRRAAELMRDLNVGIIPVVDDARSRRIRGVITDRDIAMRHVAEGHGDGCTVGDHMTESATRVGPEDDVDEVMQRMRREQIRRVAVVEDGDRLVGIIAQADLAVKTGEEETEQVEETIEKISEPARPER
ncbi:MAG TPA: CBS domain-containing protein [Longimicrobiales bacterium]|nr:CBS domain-containing protein [Longimicrobiales bacterium]